MTIDGGNGISNALILWGAMLIAVQIRRDFTTSTSAVSVVQTPLLYILLAVAAVVPSFLAPPIQKYLSPAPARRQFLGLMLGIALACLGITALIPDLSSPQLLYFVVMALLLGLLGIIWPARVFGRGADTKHNLTKLWKNRTMLRLWVGNNVRARYSQAVLGILWIILLPLAQALIMSFVFSRFLRMDVGDVPFISFFFAALVPWSFFSQTIINSSGAIIAMMGLINQIYFPREILVLVKLGETIVDVAFMGLALLLIDAAIGIFPNINYVYLPLLFFISVCLSLGAGLIVSYLTVLIRDIPQLVFVIIQLLFYLTPIVYPVTLIPPEYRPLMLLNPLTALIEAYRDVIVYGHPPDLVSLHYSFVVGLLILYLGYSFFKASERRLADYL